MKTIKAIFEAGVFSTLLAFLCMLDLLYYSFRGKGTERDLLLTIGLLLVAIYAELQRRPE